MSSVGKRWSKAGVVELIRIMLSFSLEAEIDGAWPWNRWRLQLADRATKTRRGTDD
ncbi:MAG TPA: hypothetical protein VFF32_04370 [Dermatophilaceae bacterium]|nr:hypothetical protein [Dermatophilaceae bacterium]